MILPLISMIDTVGMIRKKLLTLSLSDASTNHMVKSIVHMIITTLDSSLGTSILAMNCSNVHPPKNPRITNGGLLKDIHRT